MKTLQQNSTIAIIVVVLGFIGLAIGIIWTSFEMSSTLSHIAYLEKSSVVKQQEYLPKKAALDKRKESLSIMSSAMSHINKLLDVSGENASVTSNALQTAILKAASQNRVAVRNYTPKLGTFKIGKQSFSGNITAFTVHGDYKPLIQFVASLENSLPLVKIRKIQVSPEATSGGKLRMSVELFVPQKEL